MAYENQPWVGALEEGMRTFCTCGDSKKRPFCDGSHGHSSSGKQPVAVKIERAKNYAVCWCGATTQAPFCDGAHKKVPAG